MATTGEPTSDRSDGPEGFVPVARTDEVPEGCGHVVQVGDKSVALFQVRGQFYAINNICPHQGGPLGEGKVKGHLVTCPWHDLQFDVRSGFGGDGGGNGVASYEVKVEGEQIFVSLRARDVWA